MVVRKLLLLLDERTLFDVAAEFSGGHAMRSLATGLEFRGSELGLSESGCGECEWRGGLSHKAIDGTGCRGLICGRRRVSIWAAR